MVPTHRFLLYVYVALYLSCEQFVTNLCLVLQAVSFQKKAVIVCERVFGVDHPDTIIAYVRGQKLLLLQFGVNVIDNHCLVF